MVQIDEKLAPIPEYVKRRNAAEAELHRARKHWSRCCQGPSYAEGALIERNFEPERQIIFQVPWVDDKNQSDQPRLPRAVQIRTRTL